MGGKNILVDPNFARWIFVLKRLRRPGLRLRDLPPIDAVLVSHAHFDHLNRPSLRAIARLTRWKSGKRPTIIVPHNVRDLVSDLGYGRIVELGLVAESSAGQSSKSRTCRRGTGALASLRDMHRGYGGYVLRSGKQSLYHAGDTAYFDGFQEIGDAAAPRGSAAADWGVSSGIVPFGAYQPGGRGAGFPGSEGALDGPHALRHVSFVYEPVDEPVKRLKPMPSGVG